MESKEKFVLEQISKLEEQHNGLNILIEYKNVLKIASEFINKKRKGEEMGEANDQDSDELSSLIDSPESIAVGHIAGTISRNDVDHMRKMLFRATKGNALTYMREFSFPIVEYNGRKSWKAMYVILFQEGEYMRKKITSICESFIDHRFEVP